MGGLQVDSVTAQRRVAGSQVARIVQYEFRHLTDAHQHEVLGLLRSLPTTTVVVLHDLNLAARYCDDVILLDEGHVAGAGPVTEVLDPDLLEEVYEIGVRRVDEQDGLHLLFTPRRQQVPA